MPICKTWLKISLELSIPGTRRKYEEYRQNNQHGQDEQETMMLIHRHNLQVKPYTVSISTQAKNTKLDQQQANKEHAHLHYQSSRIHQTGSDSYPSSSPVNPTVLLTVCRFRRAIHIGSHRLQHILVEAPLEDK